MKKNRWCIALLLSGCSFLPLVHGASLEKYFLDAISDRCPVDSWNIIYKSCQNHACGIERYGDRDAEHRTTGHPTCPGFWTNAECAPLILPGETLESCETDCTNKSKASDLSYWEATHKAHLFRNRDATCETEACGEASRTPKTYKSCRSLVNNIDQKQVESGANSGSPLEREISLLAIIMSEHPTTISKITEEKIKSFINDIAAATDADLTKIRLLRVRAEQEGGLTPETVDQILTGNPNAAFFSKQTSFPTPDILQGGIRSLATLRFRNRNEGSAEKKLSSGGWAPSPYSPGNGLNSVTGQVGGTCVSNPQYPKPEAKSNTVFFYLLRVDDYSSLLNTLGFNASISVNSGLGNASGDIDYFKQISTSENAIYIVVQSYVQWEDLVYNYQSLSGQWKEIANSGLAGIKRFYDGCGDLYVNGIQKVNQFYAVYQLLARDREEKERIKASFSGSYAGQISGSAAFQTAMERVYRFARVEVLIVSPGFAGHQIPTDPEGIINYATSIPSLSTVENAVPMKALTMPYANIPDFPKKNPFIDANQRAFIEQAESDFRQLAALLNEVTTIKKNSASYDFKGKSKKDLLLTEQELLRRRLELSKKAASCYDRADNCADYVPVDFDAFWMPLPKAILYRVGGCKKENDRFGQYNGGCLDQNYALTWSEPSSGVWNYEGAKNYCNILTQNQIGGWALPNAVELLTLEGAEGGIKGLKYGERLDDLFWADAGSEAGEDGTRVNPYRGTKKDKFTGAIPLRVICRQLGAR